MLQVMRRDVLLFLSNWIYDFPMGVDKTHKKSHEVTLQEGPETEYHILGWPVLTFGSR